MKNLLLLFMLPSLLVAQDNQQAESYTGGYESYLINNHTGGLDTYHSGQRLKDDQAQVLINGIIDQDIAVVKRRGYQSYGTIQSCSANVRGGWTFKTTGGQDQFYVACSSQVYRTTGDGTFTSVGSTFSANSIIRAARTLGKLWFTNNIDNVWNTDGVSTSAITTAPLATLIAAFKSRVAYINYPGNQSTILLSGYQDGTNVTLPNIYVDTSPVQFFLNGPNDGRIVTCVFDGFRDVLILFNEDQMYGLYGNGVNSFALRLLNNQVGCVEQGSVQEHINKLRWLSKRGVEEWDGTQVTRVSYPVQDQVDNIINTQSNTLSLLQTTQADFTAGSSCIAGPGSCLSTTLSPGNVQPSTWTAIDTSTTDFVAGTVDGVNMSAIPLNLWLVSPLTENFTSSNFQGSPNYWTVKAGAFSQDSNKGITGTFEHILDDLTNVISSSYPLVSASSTNVTMQAKFNLTYQYYDGGGNDNCAAGLSTQCLKFKFMNGAGGDGYDFSLYSGDPPGSCVSGSCTLKTLRINKTVSGVTSVLNEGTFYIAAGNVIPYRITYSSAGLIQVSSYPYTTVLLSATDNTVKTSTGVEVSLSIYSNRTNYVKDFSYVQYNSSGSILSKIFNLTFSTPVPGPFNSTFVTPSSTTLLQQIRQSTSPNNDMWSNFAFVSSGTQSPVQGKRYNQYLTSMTTIGGDTTPTFSNVTLTASATGQFITNCFNPGTSITSFGNFQANTLPQGGSVAFEVSTGPTCGSVRVSTANWTSQSNNATVVLGTSAFIGVRATVIFSSAIVQQPQLQDITINYQNGQGRPPVMSSVYKDRFLMSFTTNTSASASNDTILVYDSYGHWSQFKGINAGSLWNFQRKLYTGSSTYNGKVFLQDIGYTDDGNDVLFDFKTPDYDFGIMGYKQLYNMKVELLPVTDPTLISSMTISYFVDKSSIAYPLGSVALNIDNSFILAKQFFTQGDNPTTFRTVAIRYSNTSSSPITLYRSIIRFLRLKI